MNIVYSSDNNYAQHLCVSMVSLFENNIDAKELNIFIISNDISEESKSKLTKTAEKYYRQLTWVDFNPYKDKLFLDLEWDISISSYARLFLAEMLPDWCHRAIYLDCDTVVCSSLDTLFNKDMQCSAVAGVNDLVLDVFKEKVGLPPTQSYINAGLLLIDLDKWRKDNLTSLFLRFINDHNGKVTHHDQGTINGTLFDSCLLLDPKYNVLTPYYTQKYNRMLKFYHISDYYSEEKIKAACDNPVIIHYTPEYIGRVWENGCTHPKRDIYKHYLEMTPWKGSIYISPTITVKQKLLFWIESKMPIFIIDLIRKFV